MNRAPATRPRWRPRPGAPAFLLVFLRVFLLGGLADLSSSPEPAAAQATPPARPNIVWIVADDMSPDLGAYGDDYAVTPHLDRLAAEGARFTRAFSVSGVCAPSRSALVTGMFPTTIGSHHMRSTAVPPPHVKIFTEELRKAGYFTSNQRKTDYNLHPDVLREPMKGVLEAPIGAWDWNGPDADWSRRAPAQPFFSVFNLGTTHEGRLKLPEDQLNATTATLRDDQRHDPARARLPAYYPDNPVFRADWARYHDLVTVLDREVGVILDRLAAEGLADDTVVFFFGDHGRGLPRAKRWVYDSGIRVPLLVRWPGQVDAASVRDDLVSFVDFAPTVLSIAGVAAPGHLQGRAFLGPDAGPEPPFVFAARDRMDETYDVIRCVRGRRWAYLRNFEPDKPYAQPIAYADEMPSMREWRRLDAAGGLSGPPALFFRRTKPAEELYDLDADPDQVNDLASAPEHRAILVEMRGALERWMTETGDLGLVPEQELVARMRPGSATAAPTASTSVTRSGTADDGAGTGATPWVEVTLASQTAGASIEYATGVDARWRLYAEPLRLAPATVVRVRAGRLGFYDSPTVELALGDTEIALPERARPSAERPP